MDKVQKQDSSKQKSNSLQLNLYPRDIQLNTIYINETKTAASILQT
jgi:hypothetical protein